jgi:cytidylate kinase
MTSPARSAQMSGATYAGLGGVVRTVVVDAAMPSLSDPTRNPGTPAGTPPRLVIAIDGPAGTGKSSVARALAKRLGFDFLDTGSMYRAAAALVLDDHVDASDEQAVCARVAKADLHFDWSKDPPEILANGVSLHRRIRDEDVRLLVSPLAGFPRLREHMVRKQRIIADQHPRLVTEGRDQGSVVFPDALCKVYLTARPDERARRRAKELGCGHDAAAVERLRVEIEQRDQSDSSRAVGPLVRPPDAELIDTSELTFDQVVARLEGLARARLLAAGVPA